MSDLKSSLERFSKTADRFNKAKADDTSDGYIRFAEASLIEANVRFVFWLDEDPNDSLTRYPVDDEEDVSDRLPDYAHEIEKASFLGFAEFDGIWQFAVRQVVEFTEDGDDLDGDDLDSSFISIAPCATADGNRWRLHLGVTPLAQAPLTIRVAAARKLPTFIDAFASAIDEATPAEDVTVTGGFSDRPSTNGPAVAKWPTWPLIGLP